MKLVVLLITVISSVCIAQNLPLYYGADFLQSYQDKSISNTELRSMLFKILSGGHVKKTNTPDQIFPDCKETPSCVQHQALGYDLARKKMFGYLYLKKSGEEYSVTDVYCNRAFTNADFKDTPSIGPDLIPRGGNILNTEHTWPQSKFSNRFVKHMQKSDLHHLFPTDSEMNNRRAALHFGNVVSIKEELKCHGNKLGIQENGETVYEVPDFQKGNTARAIFYFATRYQMIMSLSEQTTLREWDKLDPVDEEEYLRNEEIEKLQGNRNPYIDFSDLLSRIDRF